MTVAPIALREPDPAAEPARTRAREARYAMTTTSPPAAASKMKWLPVATIVKSMNGGTRGWQEKKLPTE